MGHWLVYVVKRFNGGGLGVSMSLSKSLLHLTQFIFYFWCSTFVLFGNANIALYVVHVFCHSYMLLYSKYMFSVPRIAFISYAVYFFVIHTSYHTQNICFLYRISHSSYMWSIFCM